MACFRQRQYMDSFCAFTQLRVYLALPRLSTECARNPCLYFEALGLYLSVCGVRQSPDMAIKCRPSTLLLIIQSHENIPRLNIVREYQTKHGRHKLRHLGNNHGTCMNTPGWVNYANKPSQAALERSSQNAYDVTAA